MSQDATGDCRSRERAALSRRLAPTSPNRRGEEESRQSPEAGLAGRRAEPPVCIGGLTLRVLWSGRVPGGGQART